MEPKTNTNFEAREKPEFEEIVVKVKRCTKVTKGGKRMSFSALVTVGNRKGQVGFGKGKAREVPFAVEKAIKAAKKNLVTVSLKDTTIPHQVEAKDGASRVIIRPAAKGTGIIAGASVRAVLELAGIENVLAKILGSTNPMNVIKATVKALQKLRTKPEIEQMRGVSAV